MSLSASCGSVACVGLEGPLYCYCRRIQLQPSHPKPRGYTQIATEQRRCTAQASQSGPRAPMANTFGKSQPPSIHQQNQTLLEFQSAIPPTTGPTYPYMQFSLQKEPARIICIACPFSGSSPGRQLLTHAMLMLMHQSGSPPRAPLCPACPWWWAAPCPCPSGPPTSARSTRRAPWPGYG